MDFIDFLGSSTEAEKRELDLLADRVSEVLGEYAGSDEVEIAFNAHGLHATKEQIAEVFRDV